MALGALAVLQCWSFPVWGAVGESMERGGPSLRAVPADAPSDTPLDTGGQGRPSVYRDEQRKLEFTIPAPYWKLRTREDLSREGQQPGCGGGRLPESVLWRLDHEDADCRIACTLRFDSFLMQNHEQLKALVAGRDESILKELGDKIEAVPGIGEQGWSEMDGMKTYRFAFGAPTRAGRRAFQFADHFVRRGDGDQDAFRFVLVCDASAEAFERLRPELASVFGGIRYTGPMADEFFAPGASEDRLLQPEDLQGGSGGGSLFWLYVLIPVLAFWLILRRRREPGGAGNS